MREKRGNKKKKRLILNNIKKSLIGLKSKQGSISSDILRDSGFSKKNYSIGSLSSSKPKKLLRSLIGSIF